MQDLPNLSRRDSDRRRLATVTAGALAALLAVAIPFGHRHVLAAAPAAPDVSSLVPASSGSSMAGLADVSVPDAGQALRPVPTSTDEPAPTF